MSSVLTITPHMRFNELRRLYWSMIPQENRTKGTHRRHIAPAASLAQIAEAAILERALGAKHDRAFIEQMKSDIHEHLAAAGVRIEAKRGSN